MVTLCCYVCKILKLYAKYYAADVFNFHDDTCRYDKQFFRKGHIVGFVKIVSNYQSAGHSTSIFGKQQAGNLLL